MEHNSLTSIASARPIIYAEGLFASCYLENGNFVPEEGLSQHDLWNILNGDFMKSGSDLVEDFTLKCKLNKLEHVSTTTNSFESYELEQYPKDAIISAPACNIPDDRSIVKDREEMRLDGIPLVQISMINGGDSLIQLGTSQEIELRKRYEKQVSWILGSEEGEEFVNMEVFSSFNDALMLLDVLKEYNVPSVVSFLSRRDEPVAITFSKIQIGLDCLMFCLFQA